MRRNRVDQLTEADLAHAAACFGLRADQLQPCGGYSNLVYAAERSGRPVILRLTHRSHRTAAQIQTELDWISYLGEHEVPVSRPLRSRAGALVEQAGAFTAAAFERAPGRKPGHVEGLQRLGRIAGRMHRLAQRYPAPTGPARRFEWHENSYLAYLNEYIPAAEERIHATIARTFQQLHSLPVDASCYGLIHGDLYPGNYMIDEAGDLTLFDFDECQHAWFANDLGILLFYTAAFPDETTREDVARFMDEFVGSYLQEMELDPFWLKQLPLFVRLRQMILYATIHHHLRTREREVHPWVSSVFAHARHTLEHDLPPVELPR